MDISQQQLLHLAHAVYREIVQANDDDDKVVHTVLDKYGYESLSEHDKLFVLTHTRYDDKNPSLCEVYQIDCCERRTEPCCQCSCTPKQKFSRSPCSMHAAQLKNMQLQRYQTVNTPPQAMNILPQAVNSPLQAANIQQHAMNIPLQAVNVPQHVVNIPPPGIHMPFPAMKFPWTPMHMPPPLMNISAMPAMNIPPPTMNIPPPPAMNIPPPTMNMPPPTINILPMAKPLWNIPPPPGMNISPQQMNIQLPIYNSQLLSLTIKTEAPVQHGKNPLWKHVISTDKVNCMKALLSRTPLYAIHKANMPQEIRWLSHGWIDLLHEAQARWNSSEICEYNYAYCEEDLDDVTRFTVMKKIAFTMHTTELFSQCCKFNARKCMQFLLATAPNLIHMKASSEQNRLALATALLYASPITDDLLRIGAVVGREDSAATLAMIYMKQSCCCSNKIQRATGLLSQGNEDLMAQYENRPGETLLHILYNNMSVNKLPKLEDTIHCTKFLLKVGVDPTKKFNFKTALDVLVGKLLDFRYPTYLRWHFRMRNYIVAAQTLTACVQILLPAFKGQHHGDVTLPASLENITDAPFEVIHARRGKVFITLLQLVMDNGVQLNAIYFIIMNFFIFLPFRGNEPCTFCVPAVRLLFTIICHGTEEVVLQLWVDSITRAITSCSYVCHASAEQQCILPHCCLWEILELLVHAGSKIGRSQRYQMTYLDRILSYIKFSFKFHINNGCSIVLQRIARFVKMSWLHCTTPEDRYCIAIFINNLVHTVHTNDYAVSVLEGLYEFTRNVLPLKTLTRQCIIQHVVWKDVKHLPLPKTLKVYVSLGEISEDHPVHAMSKDQLIA